MVSILASTCQIELAAQSTCQLRLSVSGQSPSVDTLWQADNLFWVSQTQSSDSRYDVYVVGDTLRLSPASFPMLARTDDRPITNWNRIVFDARKIIIAMPLIFDSATVELRAESVVWEAEGRITLKAPRPGMSDGVRIVAHSVDFSDAPPVPFDFDTDNWKAYPSNDKDISTDQRWKRFITLHAGKVTPPSGLTKQSADAWFWLRDLSRDRWDVLRGGPTAIHSRRPYSLKFEIEGDASYVDVLKNEMFWPAAFAGKVERVFSQSPYDASGTSLFLERLGIDRYMELFSDKPRHLWSTQSLALVSGALHQRVDLFGYASDFVPRVKFEVLKGAFERQFDTSQKLTLRALEAVLGDKASKANDVERKEQLGAIDAQRKQLRAQIAVMQSDGARLAAAIEIHRQDYVAEAANLESFKKKVDGWAVEKQKSNEERRKLAVAVDAIGLIGTTVLTAYAGPQAGMVFGKAWATVGGTVVKHLIPLL